MPTPSEPQRRSEFGAGSSPPRRSIFANYRPSGAAVPLTPALSPGEREKQGTRVENLDAHGAGPALDDVLPLPGGEGRGEGERSTDCAATLQSSIDTALARTFIYRLLAKAYEDPEPEGWQWLSSQPTKSALWSAAAALNKNEAPLTPNLSPADGEREKTSTVAKVITDRGRAPAPAADPLPPHRMRGEGQGENSRIRGSRFEPLNVGAPASSTARSEHHAQRAVLEAGAPVHGEGSQFVFEASAANLLRQFRPDAFDDFHYTYVTCFGHTVRGDCPMNEIEYGDIKADPLFQPHRLADLGAFYAAFGLEMTPDAAERQDHISIELEFMSVLAAKETYGLEHQLDDDQTAICREAQKKFLREHLGRWTPAFTRRLARMAGDTALGALAGFTREFITGDCARFKVTPGSEDLLLRPLDESSESLCASCGITNLPPGATSSLVEG